MNISQNLLIEGWREISHSYAMVNQYQIREILKIYYDCQNFNFD